MAVSKEQQVKIVTPTPTGSGAKPAIIIGIDFGTTFSGAAYALSTSPDDIVPITNWDSEANFNSDVEKSPTRLYYGENGTRATHWGFGVPVDGEPLSWFKLLLLDPADMPASVRDSDHVARAKEILGQSNKSATDAVTSYMRFLWNHIIRAVRDRVGDRLVEKSRFHIAVTVPAIWPHYALSRMRQAVMAAGILQMRDAGETTLRFVGEPEAAALSTLREYRSRKDIGVGDYFVICDAGGGTVDLITYQVVRTEPFTVKEVVKGEGGLCGGIFLDEGFLDHMKSKITPESWSEVDPADIGKFLNDNWEHGIKPQFDGSTSRVWAVDAMPEWEFINKVKGDGKRRRRTHQLSGSEVLSIFQPIVSQVEALVRAQVSALKEKTGADPRYIILVGGFGKSRFLCSRLRAEFSKPDGGTEVIQATRPWSAIFQGAVMHACTQLNLGRLVQVGIASRVSRMSCGVEVQSHWEDGSFLPVDKFWCPARLRYIARNQVDWFLKQGHDVSERKPILYKYVAYLETPPDSVRDEILYSRTVPIPDRKDENVSQLCTIKWDSKIDFDRLPTFTNNLGQVFYELSYEIEMTCHSSSVEFAVIHNGARVGSRDVEIDFVEVPEEKPHKEPGRLRIKAESHGGVAA